MIDWQGKPLGIESDGRIIAASGQALAKTVQIILNK